MPQPTPIQALLPYIWLAFNAFVTALFFALTVRLRVRGAFMLAGALTMTLIGVWFSMIASTAGASGHNNRDAVATALRIIALLAGPIWSIWLIMYARSIIQIKR